MRKRGENLKKMTENLEKRREKDREVKKEREREREKLSHRPEGTVAIGRLCGGL